MSKPIEPGCRARVVNCKKDAGEIVRVGNHIGEHFLVNGDMWEVDIALNFKSSLGMETKHKMCPARNLQRIDDYDGNEKGSWEALKGIWEPEDLTINTQ